MTQSNNTRGVVYFFSGMKVSERLIVSLFTLRKHWQGNVCVIVTGDPEGELMKKAAQPLDLQVKRVEREVFRRNAAYMNKTLIPTWTPYDETIYIDADTAVVGTFDELFQYPLGITQFSDWISQGSRMSKRIKGWKDLTPAVDALVRIQLSDPWPAINTGVFGFHKGYAQLARWHTVTAACVNDKNEGIFMADELGMQLLYADLPKEECHVFDDRYNCSPLFGIHKNDVRIWHFHGKKHIKKPQGRELWEPLFREACGANVAGINEWAGQYDGQVKQIEKPWDKAKG